MATLIVPLLVRACAEVQVGAKLTSCVPLGSPAPQPGLEAMWLGVAPECDYFGAPGLL